MPATPRASKSKTIVRRSKAATGRSTTRASASGQESIGSSGLSGFALHESDASQAKRAEFNEMRSAARSAAPTTEGAARGAPTATGDVESIARAYLDRALETPPAASVARARAVAAPREFTSLGAEAMPLTGTTVVKFRQTYNGIPIYGSYVTVELGKRKECVGVNTSTGAPQDVPDRPTLGATQARANAAKSAGHAVKAKARLFYYFDPAKARWRLVYIFEDVPVAESAIERQRAGPAVRHDRGMRRHDALRHDYVIDAQTGTLVAKLPRTPTLAPTIVHAPDGLGRRRAIAVEKRNGKTVLHDAQLNVTTYDFAFKDPSRQSRSLPGSLITDAPNTPWPVEAIAAHANGEEVARFLRNVVKRNNIDNKGGEMVSSVNCWDHGDGVRPAKQWKNAFWDGDQMVYGQIRQHDGSFYSIANMLDVVGHEMFHGVTDHTSRLEYQTQAGALNESYSDIFGVIIANFAKPLKEWTWKIGAGFDGPRTFLRDMRDPTRYEQPKVMKNFKTATPPYTYERNDYGWVHDNSGIHNYAAYRIMTAKKGGRYVFKPSELAALFFIALTVQLSRTSQFADSRRGVLQAARSLFRGDTDKDSKIAAVEAGFDAAGVVEQ